VIYGKKIAVIPPVAIPVTTVTGVIAIKTASSRQEVPKRFAIRISRANPRALENKVKRAMTIVPAATDCANLFPLKRFLSFSIMI